jgi:prepilin-type N-terminal cleavage/methylation domain-containing protein
MYKKKMLKGAQTGKEGFTLIEISMVLVIVGLIIGSILVGQDLIHAAEIRSTISQPEKFNSAVNTFNLKFNCLPGDCANAADWGFANNGNGDGIIGMCSASPGCQPSLQNLVTIAPEGWFFWQDLSTAGLVVTPNPGIIAGIGSPPANITGIGASSSYPGGWAVIADVPFDDFYGGGSFAAHSFMLVSFNVDAAEGNNHGIYAAADMYAIDAKIDDGLPFTGTVRAYNYLYDTGVSGPYMAGSLGVPTVGPGGSNAAVCVRNDTTPPQYNVQYTGTSGSGLCGIVIKAAF